ncbi:Undecaprenyl-phosphate galactosephosphotransferase [Serinicoccus hydrothermalis]|uniref:Undecaprenyl-phosphate galactosephosphotransferase n=2 Tax=Serinicoccus hydrothermalis TaxID=1758689 RepID=A0A1B1NBA0_9MICO|nr:Undecaprenyl-phosphate galactosephosphotransferase [Serinicoccus hydrothermalis]
MTVIAGTAAREASGTSMRTVDASYPFVIPDSLQGMVDRPSGGRRTPHRARRYLAPYLSTLKVLDLVLITVAVLVAYVTRFGLDESMQRVSGIGYGYIAFTLVLVWVLALHVQRAYDGRTVGHGVQEYRQVFAASTWVFAAVAIVGFAFRLEIARGFVILAFPLGTLMLLAGRWGARRWLVARRKSGQLSDRVILVGDANHVAGLVTALRRSPDAGYNVLGACVDDAEGTVQGVPVLGPESDVLLQALDHHVDVVAVSSSAGLGTTGLRQLGWALESTDIDLVVAPGIMDVAGPRVLTRPVQGLPLIHVEAPRFVGPERVLKNVMDRLMALAVTLVLLPVMLAVALAVKLEDRGPVLFRQERIGQDGRSFSMFKFRSMVMDAEDRLAELRDSNEGAGPMFKMQRDPRVTRVGAFIRRYSLDELPQLLNVLRGEMSLVGPRPPLPREVAEYARDTHRRLLVRPGMTGLWQISGRSDLSWEEAVRLDLYYVENWSPLLDGMIMWRTARVVLGSESGAY